MSEAKGWSVFWREAKKRWILARAPDWKQKILTTAPHENTKAAERAAIRVAQEWMAGQGERPTEAVGQGTNTAVAVDRWLKIAERKVRDGLAAPATLKDYRIDAKLYILPHFGTLPLKSIDVPRAREWLRTIRNGKSASTVRGARSSAATFYACALAEGWVKGENPFNNKAFLEELPALPMTGAPQVVPLGWVQRLLDDPTIPLAWRARYVLAATSGARDGEIHGARFCDVDIDAEIPVWRIEQATAIVGPEGFASTKAPKTNTSVRTLPLHPSTVAALRAWIADGWSLWTRRNPSPTDLIFPGEDGKPSRPRSAEMLRADLAHVGLPDVIGGVPVEFKSLRVTFATSLAESDVDEHIRRRLMGHGGRSVTERHYTRREMASLSAAVATIGLAWPVTRSQVVASVTEEADMVLESAAAPGRFERPTNGLGSLCDDAPGHSMAAQASDVCALATQAYNGQSITSDRGSPASGRSGHSAPGRFAVALGWWDDADRFVANELLAEAENL